MCMACGWDAKGERFTLDMGVIVDTKYVTHIEGQQDEPHETH